MRAFGSRLVASCCVERCESQMQSLVQSSSCLRCPEKGQEGVQRGRTRIRLGRAAPLAERSSRWSSRLLLLPHISHWSTQGLLQGQIPHGRGCAAGLGCVGGAPQLHPSSGDREDPKHHQGHTKGNGAGHDPAPYVSAWLPCTYPVLFWSRVYFWLPERPLTMRSTA